MKFAVRIVLWLGAIALTIFGLLLMAGALDSSGSDAAGHGLSQAYGMFIALLGGATALIRRVRRENEALGLGLAATLLALVVHSLFYSGFFEDPITWTVLAVASCFVLTRADPDAILGGSSAPIRNP